MAISPNIAWNPTAFQGFSTKQIELIRLGWEAALDAVYEVEKDSCPEDNGVHEWRDEKERYGDDADGNRGVWVNYKRCVKCGDQR